MGWKRRLTLMLLITLVAAGFWLFELDVPAAQIDAKYRNAASAYFELEDGSRVHYRDQGNPAGLPLVLIHGSNASLHTWEPWVAILGGELRMVTLDLPGHGLTGRTQSDDYSSEAYVAVVRALVAHLDLGPFVLGGNSMGGRISWRYALAHPADVRALILLAASGPNAWRQGRAQAQAKSQRSGPLAFRLLRMPSIAWVGRYLDPYYLTAQGLRASYGDPSKVDDELIARYYDLTMRAGTRATILKRFARLPSDEPFDLSLIDVPTLILWGEEDAVIPSSIGEQFAAELPQAELKVYPGIGHLPMEEVPARSAEDVRLFVKPFSDKELNVSEHPERG